MKSTRKNIKGLVVRGKGLGRKFGMPTANIDYGQVSSLPEFGVYATIVIFEGKQYLGVTNVGLRPSVDSEERVTVEVHILDFDKMIYGKMLDIELVKFLRPIKKFNGLEEVKKQVDIDIESTRELLNS